MKTLRLIGLMLFAVVIMLGACDKDDDETGDAVGTEEAAEVVAGTISKSAGGLSAQIEDATNMAGDMGIGTKKSGMSELGTEVDSSRTISSPEGAPITYNYEVTYSYELALDGMTPVFNLQFTSTGEFDCPRVSSNNQTNAVLIFSNLLTGTTFVMNGTCQRTGSTETKFGTKTSFTSTLNLSFTNVQINKLTRTIESGSASVSISGTNLTGETFSYSGNLTYNGNETASLTMGKDTFTINLDDGSVTKS